MKKRIKGEKKNRGVAVSYIAAFSTAILVFVLGIWLGNYIASSKSLELQRTQEKLISRFFGLELRNEMVKYQDICALSWGDIWKDKVEMGQKVINLETRLGKENPDVLQEKEVYELIEIKVILLLREIRERCKENFTTILYFYTNKKNDPKGDWRESENQGYVLDSIGAAHNMKGKSTPVYIFAFDINIENPVINYLKNLYNITRVPALVINEHTYTGLMTKNEIEKILEK